jgi:hypothetical protein
MHIQYVRKIIMSRETYTINGKEYQEFDINKRCAEINNDFLDASESTVYVVSTGSQSNPCQNPSDTWPIIEKVWDELMDVIRSGACDFTKWDNLMAIHNCSKLKAACICLIELND